MAQREKSFKQECVDFYHGADTKASVRDFSKGKTTWTIESFYRSASLSEHERDNVKKKFDELYKALGNNDEQFKNMLIIVTFIPVFMDMSDTDISNYPSNMMNIINTLKSLEVKFLLFTHCDKQYNENSVFTDTYKSVLDKPQYWLNETMDWILY